MALGVQANASTQREWFCVAVELDLKLKLDLKFQLEVDDRNHESCKTLPIGSFQRVVPGWPGLGDLSLFM